jgi:uncharacterized protein (TIGR03083 family)
MSSDPVVATEESWRVIAEQRLALADLLAGLSEADWEQPSLCAGWRVRDVAAHVTLIAIPPSRGSLLVDFVKARGNYARFNTVASQRRAARRPTQLVQDFRTTAESRSVPWPANPSNVLWDLLVHAQDIAIPLGIDFRTPPEAGAAAATRIWNLRWPLWFDAKRRLGSLTLTATDADWTVGAGPVVAGPIRAILLLLTGRIEAATPLLRGEGVHSLPASDRTG